MNTISNAEVGTRSAEIKTTSATVALVNLLRRIADLDPGSVRPEDRMAIVECIDEARYRLKCAEDTTDASGAWNYLSEAPKDRPIVVMGKVMVSDEFSTAAIPFCGVIEWRSVEGHEDWYLFHSSHDGHPMTLRRGLDEEVIIHYWQEVPVEKTKVTVV